jgi:hypothetical protein
MPIVFCEGMPAAPDVIANPSVGNGAVKWRHLVHAQAGGAQQSVYRIGMHAG